MHKDVDRRVGLCGAVDIQLLDLARTIRNPLRHPEDGARVLAVRDPTFAYLIAIGGIHDLIVGVV